MSDSEISPLPKNYSASRELRNRAEKMRRDKLNRFVKKLEHIVPFVVNSQRKVDRSSVLRLSASYIKLNEILNQEKLDFAGNKLPLAGLDATRSLIGAVGGFLLVLSSSGEVLYVSEAIEDTFGYTQADVMGQSFFGLIHENDEHLTKQKLASKENERLSFYCRMLEKSSTKGEFRKYEIVSIVGVLKQLPKFENSSAPSVARPRRRTSSGRRISDTDDDEAQASTSTMEHTQDTHMLVSFVQVVKDRPITDISRIESTRDEYITRHRADGSIVYTDHRISYVAGLMPEEVRGRSAFLFMCHEDLVWSWLCLKLMKENPDGRGVVTYRLRCPDGSLVSLRSQGYIELNVNDTFVCINTVLSDDDCRKELQKERSSIVNKMRSHDPRVLATDMYNELNWLRRSLKPSKIEESLRSILKGSRSTDWDFDAALASAFLTAETGVPKETSPSIVEIDPHVTTIPDHVFDTTQSPMEVESHKRKTHSDDVISAKRLCTPESSPSSRNRCDSVTLEDITLSSPESYFGANNDAQLMPLEPFHVPELSDFHELQTVTSLPYQQEHFLSGNLVLGKQMNDTFYSQYRTSIVQDYRTSPMS